MKKLTIMSDYSAWGLWENNQAIDYDYLIQKGFPNNYKLKLKLIDWQNMYEDFNFYTSEEITQKTYKTKEFKEFMKIGQEIFEEIGQIVKKYNLPFEVEYFNEETSERIQYKGNK